MLADTVSTSCHRVPHGQNIAGGVFIPVMGSAARACPFTNAERHPLLQRAARTAHLAGREPAVNLDHGLSVHCGLGFDSADRVTDSCIAQAASKAVVFDHAAQVEVFDADHIETGYKAPRQFVGNVLAGVCDLLVQHGDPLPLPLVAVRALHLAGKGLLLAFHLPLVAVRVLRIGDALAGGERGEAADAEVDANRLACFWERRGLNVHHHRDEVLAGRLANHGHGGRVYRHMLGPLDLERADLGQHKALIANLKLEGGTGVFSRLAAILPFEGRVLGALLKEVAERGLKMAQRILNWNAGHFVQPDRFRLALQYGQRSAGLDVVHPLAVLERFGALVKAPVVDVPHAAERLRKLLGLRIGWVASEGPSLFHALHYTVASCKMQWNAIPPRPERRGLSRRIR